MDTNDYLIARPTLKDLEGPTFDEPWQSRAFSLVVAMHKAGLFEWTEWVEFFGREVTEAPALPGETVNDAYYRQWMAALDKLVTARGLTNNTGINARAEAWRKAYLNTPHGRPIALQNADCPPAYKQRVLAKRDPVKVAPPLST